MRPRFVDNPDSWFSDRKVRASVNGFADADDLQGFALQAVDVGERYRERGRTTVADYFLGLAGAALDAAEEQRREDGSADSVDIAIPLDPTAPAEHLKDDIGTILAHVLALIDDESGVEVVQMWRDVLTDLLMQRDELRRRGRIL